MLFLLFQLGADRYALPARDVVEVLPILAWKELPGAPRGVAGLVDYRGTPVPVIDVSALATGQPAARRVSTRVLLVHYRVGPSDAPRLLGLLVERATEMAKKSSEEFQPAGVHSPGARYLGPVASDARGMIQRIEIAELLDGALRTALFPEQAEARA